jgi:hypothetical protein
MTAGGRTLTFVDDKNRPAVKVRAGEKLTDTRFAQNELAGAAAMPSAVEILYNLTCSDNPEKHNVKYINALPAPAHPMLN